MTPLSPCVVCATPAEFYCLKPPASYFRCRSCDAIFQHPMPSLQEMAGYADREYSEGVYKEYVAARDLKYLTFRARAARIERRTRGRRLADIGCSCGYFIDVALEHGFDATGVEFSPVAIAAASNEARPRIIQGDVNTLHAMQQASFDVVTAFDIVEHVLDPVQFLTQLKGLLKREGLLAITTPDTGHVLRPLMGTRWPMLQPFQHTCLFSAKSLRMALETAGYADIEIMPARKVLTADYLAGQIKTHNPLLAHLYDTLSRALPRKWRDLPLSVNIGEIMAFARPSPRS